MSDGFATTGPTGPRKRPRVLVVGGGFAGFHTLRRLERLLPEGAAELVLVNATDYLLYSPLLPEVATGTIEPRHIAVALRQTLRRTKIVLGHVTAVDLGAHTAEVTLDPGRRLTVGWDRLVLTPGAVTRQFDIPGVAEHANGFKTLTEALYLRDHVLTQLDLAEICPDTPAGRAERAERLTVVAVGAGYTGTEFVAQMQRWLTRIAGRWDRNDPQDVRWVLVDRNAAVLPELGEKLGAAALKILRDRGVDIRLGVTVASATATSVVLTDGTEIGARTLVWGAGVAASPLIATLDLPTDKGRLTVDAQMRVADHDHVWAAGDAAAVPDLAQPAGESTDADPDGRPLTPPTAQHAQRQGVALARNIAASLGTGEAAEYRHSDLGLVADLGGADAVARPLGVSLTGRPAKAVARAYHLYALPGFAQKARVAFDWIAGALLPVQVVQVSAIRTEDALISAAQDTGIYAAVPTAPTAPSPPPAAG